MDEFFEKLSKVTVGVVISGIFGLTMNILLGRFLSGAEYGTFRVFFSSVLMVGGFLSFGLERRTASLLARNNHDSEIASRMAGMAIIFILLLAIVSLILWSYIETFLGGEIILLSFIFSTTLYIIYKYSMGAFKGFRKEEFVGLQNIVIGILKLAVVLLVFFLGYSATEISVLITLVYFFMVLVSAYWLGSDIDIITPCYPSMDDFKLVMLSNTRKLGGVIILSSMPILVDLFGGTSVQAGIIGATVTLSAIPLYAYEAIMHVILPEVSSLEFPYDEKAINSRVGGLTWLTLSIAIFWSTLGYFIGPKLVELVFGSGFIISSLQGFLIFSTSGIFLFASLFTEVLLGLNKEKYIAISWVVPLFSLFLVLVFPYGILTSIPLSMLIYTSISTLSLTVAILKKGIKIWKLDLSQSPWKN